ncbi:hypothetical protein BJV82DRAFT_624530 [Fennellomyces sp. T-0311]|nr:hypothetical protein BJV82DRAFT_624530 [Fennellomyces sp. T-0311]
MRHNRRVMRLNNASIKRPSCERPIALSFFIMFIRQVCTITKRTTTPLSRRMFSSSRIASQDGAGTKKFAEKEKAAEKQWAQKHDEEKLKALRKALEEQEKATNALRKDLEALEKGK